MGLGEGLARSATVVARVTPEKADAAIDAVTLSVSGMYGGLQGLIPALPSIALLELRAGDAEPS